MAGGDYSHGDDTLGASPPSRRQWSCALKRPASWRWWSAGREGVHTSSPAPKKSLDLYPPSQKATGVNPWMNARWVPSGALAKEGTLRRVPPYEACGEVPRPQGRGAPRLGAFASPSSLRGLQSVFVCRWIINNEG